MNKFLIGLGQMVALAFFSVNAHAVLIDFNGLGVNTDDPLTTDGFVFDYQDRNGWAIGVAGVDICCSLNNGTDAMLIRDTSDYDMTIEITQDGGGTFSLNSLDVFDGHRDAGGMAVSITGFLGGGGTVVHNLVTAANTFSNVVLAGFDNLTSVSIRGTGSGNSTDAFQIDNITLNAGNVPVPATLGLVFLGLAGLACRRKNTGA